MISSKYISKITMILISVVLVLCVLAMGFSDKLISAVINTGYAMEYCERLSPSTPNNPKIARGSDVKQSTIIFPVSDKGSLKTKRAHPPASIPASMAFLILNIQQTACHLQ